MSKWNQTQPAVKSLDALIRKYLPTVTRTDIGVIVRKTRGGEQMSAHSEGRAIDAFVDAKVAWEKDTGDRLFNLTIEHESELGLDHVIWNREIWSPGRGRGVYPRPDDLNKAGRHPHTDHVHIAFTQDGSQRTSFPDFERALRNLSFQNFVFFADVRLQNRAATWSTLIKIRFTVYGFGDGQGSHPFVRNRWNCETRDWINLEAWDTYGYFWYDGQHYQCYDQKGSTKTAPAFVLEDAPTWSGDQKHASAPGTLRIENPRNEFGKSHQASWRFVPV